MRMTHCIYIIMNSETIVKILYLVIYYIFIITLKIFLNYFKNNQFKQREKERAIKSPLFPQSPLRFITFANGRVGCTRKKGQVEFAENFSSKITGKPAWPHAGRNQDQSHEEGEKAEAGWIREERIRRNGSVCIGRLSHHPLRTSPSFLPLPSDPVHRCPTCVRAVCPACLRRGHRSELHLGRGEVAREGWTGNPI